MPIPLALLESAFLSITSIENVEENLAHVIFFFFLGPHPRYMEVPRLGVESGVQLPAAGLPHGHSNARSELCL